MKKRQRKNKENESTLFLEFTIEKRICARCLKNEVYHDIRTMDWCEPCIWNFVKDDPSDKTEK